MNMHELAAKLSGTLFFPTDNQAAAQVPLRGVAPIQTAAAGDVTFINNIEYARFAAKTTASLVITKEPHGECPCPQLIHNNPYYAFAKTAQLFCTTKPAACGISPKAEVAKDAILGPRVNVHPYAVIGRAAKIGEGTSILPGAYIGDGVAIGKDCIIHSNVVIETGSRLGDRVIIHGGTVIGADGFGFAPGKDDIAKIPQMGGVQIGDDVEVGANSSIDRGALEDTVIGNGTKIDSEVQVAHNVKIGEHCMICAQTGIAGSAKIGDWVILAGHSGVHDHVQITDRVTVGAFSAITKNTPESGTYLGFPATPAADWRRAQALVRRLPKLEQRLKKLEKALEKAPADPAADS